MRSNGKKGSAVDLAVGYIRNEKYVVLFVYFGNSMEILLCDIWMCVCVFTFYIDANRMNQLLGLMMNLHEFLCYWIKLYEVWAKVKHDGITNVNIVLPNISNEMKRRCNEKKKYKPTNKFPDWINVYDTQVHKQTRFDTNL